MSFKFKVLILADIECINLASSLLKKQVFSPESVEKIVGWAVSHHLMADAETTPTQIHKNDTPTTETNVTTSTSTSSPIPSPATSELELVKMELVKDNTEMQDEATTTTTVTTAVTTPATTTTTTTTIPKVEKLEIGLKSIDYAIEMLTSHDPDTKAVVQTYNNPM